jgi:hypothetical protein
MKPTQLFIQTKNMDDPPYYGCGPWSDTKVTEFIPYPDSDYEDEDAVPEPPRLIRRNQSQFHNYINYDSAEEMRNERIRSINRFFQTYNEYHHTQLRLDGNPDSDTEEENGSDNEMPSLEP